MPTQDSFKARAELTPGQHYFRLAALKEAGVAPNLERLPFSIKVILESLLRNEDGYLVSQKDVRSLAQWNARQPAEVESHIGLDDHDAAGWGTVSQRLNERQHLRQPINVEVVRR